MRPLRELDLADELRLHPRDVRLPDARHLRHLAEGRIRALERPQLAEQTLDLGFAEARAAVADVDELAVAVGAEDE